jgi:hypothetical protein
MTAWPRISDHQETQALYEESRAAGSSHAIALICATRQPPGAVTDREFSRGIGTLAQQFDGEIPVLRQLVANARRNGYTPSDTDWYNPALVRPEVGPGDPQAFIPHDGGRGHVKRVCRKNGWPCEGAVTVKATPVRPAGPPEPPIAEDIMQRAIEQEIAKNPAKALKLGQLRQEIVEKHAAPERVAQYREQLKAHRKVRR